MNMTTAPIRKSAGIGQGGFQARIARGCVKKGDDMRVTNRVFLESDEFGREFFNETDPASQLAQVQELIESCKAECARDRIVRRVGVEIRPKRETRSAKGARG